MRLQRGLVFLNSPGTRRLVQPGHGVGIHWASTKHLLKRKQFPNIDWEAKKHQNNLHDPTKHHPRSWNYMKLPHIMKPSVPLLCHAQVWAGIGMGQGGSQPHAAVLWQAPTIGIHWASLSILKIDGNCKKMKPPTTHIYIYNIYIYDYICV